MIDNASYLLEQGCNIASERCEGINDNMYDSHYHEFYELYYLESGERYHLIEDRVYHITPGQFIFFKPYILHRSYGEKNVPFSRLLIYFRKNTLLSNELNAALQSLTGAYQLSPQDNSIFYQLMNHILDEQANQQPFHEEYLYSTLNTLLINFFRNNHERIKQMQKNRVTDVITYINAHYAEKLTLEHLSHTFFISPYYLCRKFKTYTNATIVQYINAVRIIQAQKMLFSSQKNITEISNDVGFDSLTHFERVFKRITGSTPRAIRKRQSIM